MSAGLRIRVLPSLADIPAAVWDACANPGAASGSSALPYNPFISHDFLSVARGLGIVGGAHRLAAAASRRRGRERRGARRRALLSQVAFARRIRVRPRLGRGLRARRRRLLSQAAGLGAVHAGDRPPPARGARPPQPRGRGRAGAGAGRARAAARGLLGARHLHARARVAPPRRARLPAAHRPAVPLGECRLRDVRRFPRRARGAQAQGAQARAARRARQRHHGRLAHRLRPDRGGVGPFLRLLHGHRLAQMGPAVSHPRVLLPGRARRWPTASCW